MELKASLYYKGGNSDKEYHLQLQAQDDGLFMVRAQNGRRGGTLVARDKTTKPVAYDVALKKYQSVLKEKLSEGYTEGAAGTAFVGGEMEDRITGIVPQLLNPIGEDEVERFAGSTLEPALTVHRALDGIPFACEAIGEGQDEAWFVFDEKNALQDRLLAGSGVTDVRETDSSLAAGR